MSDKRPVAVARPGFLLLRDGHAIPLTGISPDEIKLGAKHRVPHPDAEALKYRRTLTAIVDRLGFSGDFGDYVHRGWKSFQDFLTAHECSTRAGIFPEGNRGCIDLFFGGFSGPTRRQLSDRIFESASPSCRVFLGYGVDWTAWDRGSGHVVPDTAIATVGGDPSTARQRADDLFSCRLDLHGQFGFLDDKLVSGPIRNLVDKSYWPPGYGDARQRHESLEKVRRAALAFRAVFDARPEGWVDVLPVNERLVVLRTHDGAWDVLWRSFREHEPPRPEELQQVYELEAIDLPSSLSDEGDVERLIHFRQDVWDERERHEAEQAFYDRGGTQAERRRISFAEVRASWLREQGQLNLQQLKWRSERLPGFRVLEVGGGRRLALSELVDLGTFRRMLSETGYLDRRGAQDPWDRANAGTIDTDPVGATWTDAQAFCAWKERQLDVPVRLPTLAELRALRPFYSEKYAQLARGDFPWENFPPRPLIERAEDGTEQHVHVPGAVVWSEPRFHEPDDEHPEFPPPSGWGTKSRKRWIGDFPPSASWSGELPWSTHAGLRFIDAWDAYEWCQEDGWISGRFWEGPIAPSCWGAYKNLKTTFRLVVELGG